MRKKISILICSIMMATTVISPTVAAETTYVSHDTLKTQTYSELTEATNALNVANSNVSSAKAKLAEAEEALSAVNAPVLLAESELKKVQDNANAVLSTKKSELSDIESARSSAKTKMDNAKKTYDSAKSSVENAEANLEKAESALKTAREDAGVAEGEEGNTRTSLDFFNSLGDTEAIRYFNNAKYYSYSKVGDPKDATSLTNMKSAIQWTKRINDLRKSIGLSELLVTSELMAKAQSNANYSDKIMAHSNQFAMEILAWNWDNNPSVDYTKDGAIWQWYTEEKRIFDNAVDSINGNTVTYRGTYDSKSTSFTATDEQIALLKKIRANNKTVSGDKVSILYDLDFYDEVGHYLTLIKNGLNVQGFAVCSRGSNFPYTYTYSNLLSGGSWYKTYTVSEYESLFNAYMDKCTALTNAKNAYDSAKANYDKSKNTDLTALYKTYTDAKATYDSYATPLSNAQSAYNAALSEANYVNSLSYKVSTTITNEKYTYLNSILADAYAIKDEVASLEKEVTSAKSALDEATKTQTEASERVKAAQTAYDEAEQHKWSSYRTIKEATAVSAGSKTRTCHICGETDTQTIAKKKATITLPTIPSNKLTMKVGQSTTGLKISELAKGDSVASIKSSKTSIVKVSSVKNTGCTLKAGKKKGTAKVTITLKSGLKKTITVSVQTGTVKTTKLSGTTSVSVSKGKSTTLKPVRVPFTSQQKVTYKSSNTKIATVTSSGKITGKKKGSTYITVKSGSKSYKVKVTVK